MNINDPSQIRACTSCQMCGAVCPTSAISISLNKEGFYRPYIDEEKCINCSKCVKSCYKFDQDIRLTQSLKNKTLLSAWVKDKEILDSTTSGGIGDILAKELVRNGYTCIGVKYNTDSNIAEGTSAENEKETDYFRSSKYIQSLSINVFKEIVQNQRKKKYAVFGLPCQIYAMDRFLKSANNRDQHILIDLYCHGCPSLSIWQKYLVDEVKLNPEEKVNYVNFRSKERGWGEYTLRVDISSTDSNRTFLSPKINDPFFGLFFSDLVLNDSCPDCYVRRILEYTDIRLGDFWGDKFVDNAYGVSAISLASEIGKKLFGKIKDKIDSSEQSWDSLLPYQSYDKVYHIDENTRRKLFSLLEDEKVTIRQVFKAYLNSMAFRQRLKYSLKNIIKSLPQGGMKAIKKLYQQMAH